MLACGGIWECAVRRDLDQMDLLCLLLPEEREKERVRRLTPENLVPMLTKALAPEGEDYVMSREFAQRIFDVLRIRLSRKNRDYELGGILTELAQLLPADMLDENAHPLSFKEGERPDLEEALAAFSVIVLRQPCAVRLFFLTVTIRETSMSTPHEKDGGTSDVLRRHAEQQFAEELEELKKNDTRQRPAHWEMSPWAVCTYLMGGKLENGFEVSPKYIGNRRIIEIAVATLGHGSRPAAVRRARNSQILGVRASCGRNQRRFHTDYSGDGGHQ